MSSLKSRESAIAISIPVIFTIGIIAFFQLFPKETITLENFISYTSSLAAIIMVLVVIFTTNLQLKEMKSMRVFQNQPFPLISTLKKSHLEAPRYFYSPPENKTKLLSRIFFFFEIENIGDSPAIAIDVIVKLHYYDEDGKMVFKQPVTERINSLKKDEKKEVDFMVTGNNVGKNVMKTFFLSDRMQNLEVIAFYKNVLGACFMEKNAFEIWFYKDDENSAKSCLKLFETEEIDHKEEMHEITRLKQTQSEKASELLNNLNVELSKKEGCKGIYLVLNPISQEFSISVISDRYYREIVKDLYYGRLVGVKKPQELKDLPL